MEKIPHLTDVGLLYFSKSNTHKIEISTRSPGMIQRNFLDDETTSTMP